MLILAAGLGSGFPFRPGTAPGAGQVNGLDRERFVLRVVNFVCLWAQRKIFYRPVRHLKRYLRHLFSFRCLTFGSLPLPQVLAGTDANLHF